MLAGVQQRIACRRARSRESPAPPDPRPAGLPEQPRTLHQAGHCCHPGACVGGALDPSPAATCATRRPTPLSVKIDIGVVADVGASLPQLIGEARPANWPTPAALNGQEAEKTGPHQPPLYHTGGTGAGVRQIAQTSPPVILAIRGTKGSAQLQSRSFDCPAGSTSSPPGTPPRCSQRRPEGRNACRHVMEKRHGSRTGGPSWIGRQKETNGPWRGRYLFHRFGLAGLRDFETLDAVRHGTRFGKTGAIRPLPTPAAAGPCGTEPPAQFYEARMTTRRLSAETRPAAFRLLATPASLSH